MSANTLVATLLAMAGQRNVITVPRAFVKFTGSIEAAMMLNQLLYWKPRAHGEAIYKTDPEWMDELCITRYAVRKARDCLVALGVVTVEVHHVRGAPAVHYHIDFDALTERWESWLLAHDVKFENELDSPPSKVRKRTLPHESSSKTDSVKFENGRYINRMQRIHAENDDDDGRSLAFLIDKGVGAAQEFARLPYESMMLDWNNRIADQQSPALIVKAWRVRPPAKDYHYERSIQSGTREPAAQAGAARPTPRSPERARRSAGSHNPTGGAELHNPGWMDREIAKVEAILAEERARAEL